MRIIVTGGAGFIGSHVVEAFAAKGHEVLAIDNLSSGKLENLPPQVRLAAVDLRDRNRLARVIGDFRPEVIDHHAAQVSVRESVADPVYDAQVNIVGSLNLIELGLAAGARRVLFASTGGAIYGEQEKFPAPEDHPQRPLSPYAISKLAVEKYMFHFEVNNGLQWTALRYANVYGPRQDPHGEAGVVAIFSEALLSGREPVINGDGGQTRDFVFVEDVARANVLALEKGVLGPVNIATGIETDINRIFHEIKNLAGSSASEKHGPAKPGEQRRSVLDPSHAKRIMGWEPRTDVTGGLAKTVDYFRKRA